MVFSQNRTDFCRRDIAEKKEQNRTEGKSDKTKMVEWFENMGIGFITIKAVRKELRIADIVIFVLYPYLIPC
jgi:hypothetical protein